MRIKVSACAFCVALAGAITPGSGAAVTCADARDVMASADLIFSAIPTQVTQEPAGVKIPSIARHRIDLPPEAVTNFPRGHVFEIQSCSPACRTWSGTIDDLPATVVDPWYEITLEVRKIWRGSRSLARVIYSTRKLGVGEEVLFALREQEGEPLSFGGPCAWGVSVFHGSRLDEFGDILGDPVYESK